MEKTQIEGNGKLLTMNQVCEKLNVSRGWLYKKCRARILPHIRVGGMIRFNLKDLEDWINGHKIKGALKV